MSYLLKALKKAEEERLSLSGSDEATPAAPIQIQSALPGWLVVLVVSLLVVTAWKLFLDDGSAPENEPALKGLYVPIQSQLNAEKPRVDIKKTVITSAPTKLVNDGADNEYQLSEGEVLVVPVGKELISNDDVVTGLSGGIEGVSQKPSGRVSKQLAELTQIELRQIPSLSLESHLYSSVASYSSVVINGGTYAEGDYINSDIVIEKINAEGILISLGDLLVELPKGITWVSNKHVK